MSKFSTLMETVQSTKMDRGRFLKAVKFVHLKLVELNKKYKNVSTSPNKSRLVTIEGTNREGWKSLDFVYSKEYRFYDSENRFHREGGEPAAIMKDQGVYYFVRGKEHRTDGPAVINLTKGYLQFWVNGKQLTEEEYLQHFDTDL